MPNYKQAGRLMQFASTLGQDELLIQSFEGVEGISRLFEFTADLLGDAKTEIDPTQIVGTKATLSVTLLDVQGTRYINGLVASFEETHGDDEFNHYRAQMVPSLWLLTLGTNCRVFQGKTVMEIIKAVIGTYGLSVSDTTTMEYKPLDYCTQYGETDFNFISRLAEQFGIYYYFEHKSGDNTVVFADNRSSYTPCPKVSEVQYSPEGGGNEDYYHSIVDDLRVTSSLVSGLHSSRDVDFLPYSQNPSGPAVSTHVMGKNSWERYHFPVGEAGYVKLVDKHLTTPAHGTIILNAQRDASDVGGNLFHGTSTARTFQPGFTFDLTDHPRDAWNQTYLLTEVMHSAQQSPPYRGDESTPDNPYSNRFVSIESTRQYRPVAHTPKPRIMGPQTAVVVVPAGEDIFLDQQGRVCIQFFWDRVRDMNTVDNTWVRVAQPWAGNGWGTYFWPRVRDEVVVQFLDGDPDKPVVCGSVYNGVNMAKYALPDMSTRTGVLTRSSKGGTAANANELRFEDKTGSEQIFINAEKDMDLRVENDRRDYTMGQHSFIVDKDHLEQFGGDHHYHTKGAVKEQMDSTFDQTITGAVAQKFGAAFGQEVTGDASQKFDGKLGVEVTGAVAVKYDDAYSQAITGKHQVTNMSYAMASTSTTYIKGADVVIEAEATLTIKVGGNFVSINPSGVSINGMMVLINSGGAAGSGSAPSPDSPSAPTAPQPPKDPDKADDGTKGGKM